VKIVRNGIYSARLVIWMMINQRLQAGGTLTRSVEQLVQGRFAPLLSRCKRVEEKRIGLGTGGYCGAHQNLPKLLVSRTVNEVIERLRQRMGEPTTEGQPRFYVLDGSSLQLEYGAELVKTYSQAQGRHGKAHRPVVRIWRSMAWIQDWRNAPTGARCMGRERSVSRHWPSKLPSMYRPDR
jgi:hypothetical protein